MNLSARIRKASDLNNSSHHNDGEILSPFRDTFGMTIHSLCRRNLAITLSYIMPGTSETIRLDFNTITIINVVHIMPLITCLLTPIT